MKPAAFLLLSALSACATVNDAPVEELSTVGDVPAQPRAAPPPRAREHVVATGDTLYGVAFRHGVDHRQLAEWNAIPPPYTLRPGQRLRLEPLPRPREYTGSAYSGAVTTSAAPDSSAAATTQPLLDAPPARPLREPPPPPPATGPVSSAARTGTPGAPRQSVPAPHPAQSPPQPSPATPVPRPASPPPAVATAPRPATPAVAPPPAVQAPPVMVSTGPSQKVAGIAWRWPANGRVINRYVAGDAARQGVDIQGKAGQAVVAAADGEVVYSGNGLIGYGELVIIKHSSEFLSAYGHNRKRLVAEGDRVKAGQQIAEMGRSASALDLLHFEIRRSGKTVDPLTFLPRK